MNEYGNEKKPIHPASGFAARLNEHWCIDLAAARRRIEAWRIHHHTVRSSFSLRGVPFGRQKGLWKRRSPRDLGNLFEFPTSLQPQFMILYRIFRSLEVDLN